MKLEITENGSTMTGVLTGRLDTAASAQFSRDMQPLMDNASKNIILDCTNLEFISSSGLRLLLMLRKQTIANNGSVTIKGVSEEVKQVFTITGFFSLFNFE